METPRTWAWMGIALVLLTANLLLVRSRGLKAFGLVFLVLAAALDAWFPFGGFGLHPLDRAVAMAGRVLTEPNDYGTDALLALLRWGQSSAHWSAFDVWLGLSLGVVFAATPCDALPRLLARVRRWRQPVA